MQKLIFAAIFAASPVMSETANRVTMPWPEFVEASGCVIVDMGGYSNLAAVTVVNDPETGNFTEVLGGNCPFAVTQAFIGDYSRTIAGADGFLGTADDKEVSDN